MHHPRYIRVLAIIALLTSSVTKAEKLNVKKLNLVFADLVEAVLSEHQKEPNKLFTALSAELDEKQTDFSEEDRFKLRLKARATAARAVWDNPKEDSKKESSLEVNLQARADRPKKEIELGIKATLETDTLRLSRHSATKYRSWYCDPKHKPSKSKAAHAQECKVLESLEKSPDLNGVFAGLTALSVIEANEALVRRQLAEKELAKATTADEKKRWERIVDSRKRSFELRNTMAKEMRKAYEAGKEGQAFRLELKDLELSDLGAKLEVSFYLDKRKIEAEARGIAKDVKNIDDYFAQRPNIEKELLRFQSKEPKSLAQAKNSLKFFLAITREVVGGR